MFYVSGRFKRVPYRLANSVKEVIYGLSMTLPLSSEGESGIHIDN